MHHKARVLTVTNVLHNVTLTLFTLNSQKLANKMEGDRRIKVQKRFTSNKLHNVLNILN